MQLRTYMEDEAISLVRMGELLAEVEPRLSSPVFAGTVCRHMIGIGSPNTDYVRRYEVVTNGAVGPRDWHDLQLAVKENPSLLTDPPRFRRRKIGQAPAHLVRAAR